ncbi:TetR/AcrR family transcriptional regulator [Aciduricibacillus chroicocephali]|uniref:TetR/AcrR family transcriptional regulator n=1 Tax=Aciduricibacillus chroicocephali TaxID=3054939 RepID=A0ABY9KWF0_9BACI|nr:TetR/AcrR family transcriptional regulator [Bacillaceae bacterium 44XB]
MTKDKLIEAAIHNFAEHGYQGASMRKIAEAAGIKPASIYYFFENKQQLIIEAMKVILDHHFSVMSNTFKNHQNDPLHVIFSELFANLVHYHSSKHEETKAYVLLVNSSIPELKEAVRTYLDTYDTWLVDQLMEAMGARYPHLDQKEMKKTIDYFIFLGNGLFWGVIIYEEEEIQKNLQQAIYLMDQYIKLTLGSEKNE